MQNNETQPAGLSPKTLGKNQIAYSRLEENFNRITHLVGAVLALIGGIVVITRGATKGLNTVGIVALCLYSGFLLLMYLFSTLYHWQPVNKRRRAVFRRFDHCSIPLLIAGTYAPFMLIGLGGALGTTIAAIELGIAVLVIVFNAVDVHKFRRINMILYLVMGWAVILAIVPLVRKIRLGAVLYLLFGGIAFSVGVIFYRVKKIKLNHAIWHFFVLIGTVLHWIGVAFFLI